MPRPVQRDPATSTTVPPVGPAASAAPVVNDVGASSGNSLHSPRRRGGRHPDVLVVEDAHGVNAGGRNGSIETWPNFMTTAEAARYLRHSTSWLLRRGDIPYLPGRPNIFRKLDLEKWVERTMYTPKGL